MQTLPFFAWVPSSRATMNHETVKQYQHLPTSSSLSPCEWHWWTPQHGHSPLEGAVASPALRVPGCYQEQACSLWGHPPRGPSQAAPSGMLHCERHQPGSPACFRYLNMSLKVHLPTCWTSAVHRQQGVVDAASSLGESMCESLCMAAMVHKSFSLNNKISSQDSALPELE